MNRVLVTGGAGFIGSHLVDAMVARGLDVRILDSLDPQVHGSSGAAPAYLNPSATLVRGDIRDREVLSHCLDGVDTVVHLAAAVGVGQSMYEIERYVSANTLGTAVLLDLLASSPRKVERLVVASSMSIYGEGQYSCDSCGPAEPAERSDDQMIRQEWDPRCPTCGEILRPVPTPEHKRSRPTSIYAITKRDQEEMCLCVGRSYGIPSVALRFFNVYGPRQALSNPYTGVAAIFSSRALNSRPPLLYEDGSQRRDFVHVSDVVQALLLAMESEAAAYGVYNVATGRPLSIREIARIICDRIGQPGLDPEVVHGHRKGDVRHCYADISSLRALGYSPQVDFERGAADLVEWVRGQTSEDMSERAAAELKSRGLVK